MRGPDAGLSGVLVIDKPAGPSSHDIVLTVRRRQLAKRVGHGGTLDPFATGVLPVLVGAATRLSRFLTGSDKTYETVVRFGHATTTGDPEGEAGPSAQIPEASTVREALGGFVGTVTQVPPVFSAKSQDGVRAYKRARSGDLRPPDPVEVQLHEVELLDWSAPDARLRVRCGAGTYIRALARDLGEACGSAAHCAELRRVSTGQFDLAAAIPMATVRDAPLDEWRDRLVPMHALLPDLPSVRCTERGATALRHGRLVPAREFDATPELPAAEWVRILGPDGALLALGSPATRFDRPEDLHARLVLAP